MNRFQSVWERKQELMHAYIPKEMASGLRATNALPCDLDAPRHQLLLRDYAWRITEELAEATINDQKPDHEELIDVCFFFLELLALSAVTPTDLIDGNEGGGDDLGRLYTQAYAAQGNAISSLEYSPWPIIEMLGRAVHELRCTAWRSKIVITDKARYRELLRQGFYRFIIYCDMHGLSDDKFHPEFMAKAKTVEARLTNGY